MYATPANAAFLIVIGLVTGIAGAVLGTGGGVFLIPVLVLVLGVPMHYAVGTSILAVIATSTAVASVNVERGTANMRLGMTLEIATSLGAISGGLAAGWLSAPILETVFALVLLPTAALMWRGRGENDSAASPKSDRSGSVDSLGWLGARYFDPRLGREVVYRIRRLWAGLGVSFVAGIMSGLLGIGGGVFKVPALKLCCGVPIKAAAATSNFMIGVTAAASAFLYFGRGEVRPMLTAAVVLGVLVGSAVGSYVNRFVAGRAVERTFAVLLLAVAAEMFVRILKS
jgi:uncharacterized membrane protein YfcA